MDVVAEKRNVNVHGDVGEDHTTGLFSSENMDSLYSYISTTWASITLHATSSPLPAAFRMLSLVVEYVFSPQAIITNLLGSVLLYSLVVQGVKPSVLWKDVVKLQAVTVAVWLLIPSTSWSYILPVALCLCLYDTLIKKKLRVEDRAVFISDEDVLEQLTKNYEFIRVEASRTKKGQFSLDTELQYVEYEMSALCQCLKGQKGVIEVNEIAQIKGGWDPSNSSLFQKHGFQEQCTFYVVLGPGERMVHLVAQSQEERDVWVTGLQTLFRQTVEKNITNWIDRVVSADHSDVAKPVNLDDSVLLLNKINRPLDKAYAREIFQTFTESNKTKSDKGDLSISHDKLRQFLDFSGRRPEMQQIFDRLLGRGDIVITAKILQDFMASEQQEKVTLYSCTEWIKQYEAFLLYNNLSAHGFITFLMSDEQSIFNRAHKKIYQDMGQPLSHYFIATSHNTYLTKDQLKGKSSVEAYVMALKRGCKCVELDCWDGPNNEPIIYHGHTLTSKILFKDVISAINEHAFVVSDFPVILSFENHCSVEQQKVMATHLTTIFGEKLYTTPPPKEERQLPSPRQLKGKILVKARKLKTDDDDMESDDEGGEDDLVDESINNNIDNNNKDNVDNKDDADTQSIDESSKDSAAKDKKPRQRKVTAKSKEKKKAAKLAKEFSDLVAYCQAVSFHSFQHSKDNHKHYEMSSYAEKKAIKFAKEESSAFIRHNARQLSRIYPAGSRVDSGNYDPIMMWNVGCQLPALNYQTPGFPMQLNQGKFQEPNGGCGYVLKPLFMRLDNTDFDPKGPFEDNRAKLLVIKVICGYQLPYSKEKSVKSDRDLCVNIRVSGVDADVKKEQTKLVKNNGLNPTWNETFGFKVYVPELTLITFTAKESENFLGQYTLPFESLQRGYRHIKLQSKAAECLPFGSLFVHVDIRPFTNS